jgi:hypothetical protein
MAHPPNQLETAQLRISTTNAVVAYLKDLVATGLYGRHHTDAAERLLAQGIERLIQQGTLKPLSTENAQHQSGKRVRNE